MLKLSEKRKHNIILNSVLELGENQGEGKGRYFKSRFIEPGIAHYKDLGDILITKETLDKFINSMVGVPVIIDHQNVTNKNVDKLRVGTVSRVWFNEKDGWFYCEGILTDSQAIDLIKNHGWNVSCAYSFAADESKKQHNGKVIDMEFTDGNFLHLAIVEVPRYENANIVVNSKDKWITIKPNGEDAKGKHLLLKDGETPQETITRTYGQKHLFKIKDYTQKIKKPPEPSDLEKMRNNMEASLSNFQTDFYKEERENIKRDIKLFDKVMKGELEDTKENQEWANQFVNEWLAADTDGFLEKNMNEFKKKLPFKVQDFDDYMEVYNTQDGENINEVENSRTDKELNEMALLEELKKLIGKVENATDEEKEKDGKEKAENKCKNDDTDKHKLIDEIDGILKGKVDDELIRTIIKKVEKIAYDKSETGTADNKCKNEDEPEEEKEEKFEEEKEIATNKKQVKNSMDDVKRAAMGGNSYTQTPSLYTSQKERLELGNKY